MVRVLRYCGPDYPKMVFVAASVRAQNFTNDKKLETKEKLKFRRDLEVLSTAAIK